MKLGHRLAYINMMIPNGYTHIWDCCCDHGLLGAALLDRHAAMIHFVDIVPALMQQLTAKLERFYPQQNPPKWQVHCSDVSAIPLVQDEHTPLVIIAGVGGDLMIEFVNSLCQQYSNRKIDFILCPVHHQYELRQQLIKLDCKLIDEKLIEENSRFYEIIYVRFGKQSSRKKSDRPTTKISVIGNKFWQCSNDQERDMAKRYLNKVLTHYQKISLSNPQKASQTLQDYLAIKALI
ncbi:tRNA (adenine(22)-N(1))-methyltransferase [Shewanella livingstonensis]|uniref:SAM-dependent methyltransferase n=1 Tax=Shewanella livingstonensis TaxID=150120 RepID=A0A3G8LXK0_9GAMM|nr:tRNA (adenine(22)-N(1))-methyltransferase TrmK [Shewanella livingstonensis]AZG73825.1 SAM-dependent methyltransferase [Shewanella livingstonensis]